jgi:hypothetical protein
MEKISPDEILRRHGKWMVSSDFVKLVGEKRDVGNRQAQNLIKKAYKNKKILKHIFSDRSVIYGLAEFAPPSLQQSINKNNLEKFLINYDLFSEEKRKRKIDHSWKLLENEIDILSQDTIANQSIDYEITRNWIFQHFKSGYIEKIWEPLQEYLNLIEKNNVKAENRSEIRFLPIVSITMIMPKLINQFVFPKPFLYKPDNPNKHVDSKIMNRLYQLQNYLLRQVAYIIKQLDHEKPLEGYCEICKIN